MSPLLAVILWGVASAVVSMAVYKIISPQQKIMAMKASQKNSRQQLMRHEGGWDELQALIMRDLSLSFRQLAMVTGPVVISVLPVVALVYKLSEIYGDASISTLGPEWMHGFLFWYFASLTVVSLAIKIIFRIA